MLLNDAISSAWASYRIIWDGNRVRWNWNRRNSCGLFQVMCWNSVVGINELRSVFPNSQFPGRDSNRAHPKHGSTLHGIVAYLLKARTLKAEKQPLLGNGPYIRGRETRQSALVATQLCGKHISTAVNHQHPTIEEAMFSVGPSRGYITRTLRS
jgi:hypothetical protein